MADAAELWRELLRYCADDRCFYAEFFVDKHLGCVIIDHDTGCRPVRVGAQRAAVPCFRFAVSPKAASRRCDADEADSGPSGESAAPSAQRPGRGPRWLEHGGSRAPAR